MAAETERATGFFCSTRCASCSDRTGCSSLAAYSQRSEGAARVAAASVADGRSGGGPAAARARRLACGAGLRTALRARGRSRSCPAKHMVTVLRVRAVSLLIGHLAAARPPVSPTRGAPPIMSHPLHPPGPAEQPPTHSHPNTRAHTRFRPCNVPHPQRHLLFRQGVAGGALPQRLPPIQPQAQGRGPAAGHKGAAPRRAAALSHISQAASLRQCSAARRRARRRQARQQRKDASSAAPQPSSPPAPAPRRSGLRPARRSSRRPPPRRRSACGTTPSRGASS